MIPDEEVERVRDAADIVAIISEYVPLRRVGTDFRGPCPFHQGTHRNFSVSAKRRIYHCFVCGEGGDVFTFLQKRLGIDWPQAVRLAAEKTGIEIREVHTRRAAPDPREPLWEVNAAAEEYFQRVLWQESAGEAAREYLAQRAIGREVAEHFGLGFAPREIGLLRAHLTTLGYGDARQLEAGLLVQREEGTEPRPRFRARLIFPIYDASGKVAGFGGRLIGAGEPKYLNSAESLAFSKGRLLYGMNWARSAIRRADRAILVEGYFDLVRLASRGMEEVVAPLGTALTADQAQLIARTSKNVVLLYDSDRAGLRATFRAGDELLKVGATVRVVTLPDGDDPDSFVKQHGPEALERQIGSAIDVFERKIQLLQRRGWFSDLHRRRRAIDLMLPTLRAATDSVTRDMYIGRAAEATGVDRRVLTNEVGAVRAPAAAPAGRHAEGQSGGASRGRRLGPRVAASSAAPGSAAERELVRVMLSARGEVEHIAEQVGPSEFRVPEFREIFALLVREGPETTYDELAQGLTPAGVAALQALLTEPEAIQNLERTVSDCLARLQVRSLRERNADIQRLLAAASADETDRLMQEKQANTEEIRRLSSDAPAM